MNRAGIHFHVAPAARLATHREKHATLRSTASICLLEITVRLIAALTLVAPIALSAATPISQASHPTFEPNAGQMGKSVQWVVRHGAATPMFLRATGAAFARQTPTSVEFVEMRFEGARAGAASLGEEPLESYSNYYMGRDARSWFTGVPHFARVRYRDVYPGIDVVYRANASDIEYDFDVRPGADPSCIHITFHGIDSLQTRDGDLILTTGGRELRQKRPRVFQDGVEIAGNYRVDSGGRVEIALAGYDRGRELLIDPVVQFASYLGGPGAEEIGAIRVDRQGYLYIAGDTTSIVSPTLDPFSQSGLTVTSPCIFKFTPDGTRLLFFLTLAVDNRTFIDGVAIDSSGNILVTGETSALQLPLKNAIDSHFKAKQETVFAAKWTADGRSIVYSTYFGGSGNEFAAGAEVDSAGNLYFAGTTSSLDLPTFNALQPAHGGGSYAAMLSPLWWTNSGGIDCFVAKLSPQGQLVFGTYLGGSGNDLCQAMALAPDGDVVLAGQSEAPAVGSGFPTVNAIVGTPPPLANPGATIHDDSAIVAKLRGDGQSLAFSTYVGPSLAGPAVSGGVQAVAVDPDGNIYFGGFCDSGLATKNAIQPNNPRATLSFSASACVSALDSSGQNFLYTTYLDGTTGSTRSLITSMAADAQGSVYVAGNTSNSDFPLKDPLQPFQGSSGPNTDFFLARLAPAGSPLLYSTFLGGNDFEHLARVATGPDGSAYFAGTTFSKNIPVKNAFQPNPGGNADIVFMKIASAAVTAGPAANIAAFAGTPQIAGLNSAFPIALQARVTDSAGTPVGGAIVNFSATPGAATATLSAPSAETSSAGVAGVTATANGIAGTYTVTATTASVSGTAAFTLTNAVANVRVETSPPGLSYAVDTVSYSIAKTFTFAVGSVHLISVMPLIPTADGRAKFTGWSDGLSSAHGITATGTLTTYTASFTQQYLLTTAVAPAGSGTVTPASGSFYDADSTVTLTAAASGSLAFNSWTGPVTSTGPLSGTVVMSGPISVTANFGAAPPSSVISTLAHAASYVTGPIAPNEILAAFGTFPGCGSSPAQVTVGGAPAQVFYSSETQVNFLMPTSVPSGSKSSVQISCPGSAPVPFPVDLASSAPGLFTMSQDGKGQVDVVNQDGTINTPTPAGSYIAVYGSGFGAYNAPSPDGLTRLALPVTAMLAPLVGLGPAYSVNVIFAGQAPTFTTGLQQINLQIPDNAPAATMQLILTVGQTQTQAGVTLQIAPPPVAHTGAQRLQ